MTFADVEGSRGEVRLFVDTAFAVTTPAGLSASYDDGNPGPAMLGLLDLLNLTVLSADDGDAELAIDFDAGAQLRVSSVGSSWTTHDLWWLGDSHRGAEGAWPETLLCKERAACR